MRKSYLVPVVLGLVFLFVNVARAEEEWVPFSSNIKKESLKSSPGEVSIDGCLRKCHQFLENVILPQPTTVAILSRSVNAGRREPSLRIVYPSFYSFRVEAKTGLVVDFQNDRLRSERVELGAKRQVENRDFPLKNRSQVESALKPIEQVLGIKSPFTYRRITGYHFVRDERDPEGPRRHRTESKDFSDVSTITARYEVMPYGYPVGGSCDCYELAIDNLTGAVNEFSFRKGRAYVIESHEAKLSQEQANKIAEPIIKKYGQAILTAKYLRHLDDFVNPVLAYVNPNSFFGGIGPRYFVAESKNPRLMRLAWVFTLADGSLCIDAANGKVLGGFDHKEWHKEAEAYYKQQLKKP